jgi:hypothetical protein
MGEFVEALSKRVNTYSFDHKKFQELMKGQHRTIQQSFTAFCFAWVECCAKKDYQTDGRNQASHDVSLEAISGFRLVQQMKTGSKECLLSPTNYLPII